MELAGYYNMDCMDGLKEIPDKYFDLAIVDPPYGDPQGIIEGGARFGERFDRYKSGGTWAAKFGKKQVQWDIAPPQEYFTELFRVSKNQIIWGGNYFNLPPTRCFIIWRKTNIPEQFTMAMVEYAWTSFNGNAKIFDYSSAGQEGRFHPTQKPVPLYKWLLANYAKPGDKIIDTHVGSASSLIACEDMGFAYLGFEIDSEYYEKGKARLEEYKAQLQMPLWALLP